MIWNEPNNKSHWDMALDPDWSIYADTVSRAGAAIRRANPAMTRVLGGMSPIDAQWLQRIEGHGGLDEIDVVAVHGFPLDWNLWPIHAWPDKVAEIEAVTDKPVWVTEVGVGSFGAEEVQVFGLNRTAELLIGRVPRIFWYSLYDLPMAWGAETRHREAEGSSYYRHFYMGLIREDGTPKPALDDYAKVAGEMGLMQWFHYEDPAARRCGRVDEAAGNQEAAYRAQLGGQLPPRRDRLVRPADGRAGGFRHDRHLLLHPGASRAGAAPHQPGAGPAGVRRFLRLGDRALCAGKGGRGRNGGLMSDMMQAAVLTGPGTLRLDEVALPKPGPGEVRIRLEGCGVCASNVEPFEGQPWSTYPGEPGGLGHEGWGTVDAVGAGVEGVVAGDRVATLSGHSFAPYDIAPANRVVALPPAMAGRPFPGEPLGCAFNIFRRSDIRAGQTVAIVGIGFLGAVLTRLASEAGARVIAISRRQESLDLARHYGAVETVPMDDHYAIIERVQALTDGRGAERVIEAVGKQWPLDLAGELVAEGGRLVIAGYHQDGPRQVSMQMWNWKGIDVVNAHERDPAVQRRGVEEAVAAVASGRLDPAPLYSHRYPLDRLGGGDRGDARQAGRLRQGAGAVRVSKPRVGFLGVGWIGRHRLQAMLATGAIEAVAVADPAPEMIAEALAVAPGARAVADLDAMLALAPDGVVIATPSALHAEQSIRALDAGVAVFCQKPLGRDAAEAAAVGRGGAGGGPAAVGRFLVSLHQGHAGDRGAGAGRRTGPRLRDRSGVPQRLRSRPALVLRPRAVGGGLRHRPGGAPRRSGAVDPRLSAARRRGRGAAVRRRPATCRRRGGGFCHCLVHPRRRHGGAARLFLAGQCRPRGGDRRDLLWHPGRRGAAQRRRIVLRLHRRAVSRHPGRDADDRRRRVGRPCRRRLGAGARPLAALRPRRRPAGGGGDRSRPDLRPRADRTKGRRYRWLRTARSAKSSSSSSR